MAKDILNLLDQRYALDTQLYRLNLKFKALDEEIPQARWELRSREQNLVEYESGLRSLLDRLRGKQVETVEAYHREIRQAREKLSALTREKERMAQTISQLSQQMEGLPTAEQLREAAAEDPEATAYWARLETRFCAQMLKPLLEENENALNEYREQLRGARMGEIVSYEELHEIGTAYIQWGQQCAACLERMGVAAQKLEKDWEIPPYFQNPNGFIVSAAARHNRLDRANMALDQIRATEKRIAEILREMEG